MFHNEHLTRQSDLVPEEILPTPITIIGAGAIGSWVTLALAKMGFEDLTVYDHDKIDIVNLSCQFYRWDQVGEWKVQALAKMVRDFTRVKINAIPKPYEAGAFPGIVISAVDSMTVRKLVWDNHFQKAIATKAVIDPRMGAETALLYVMNPMDEADGKSYTKSLYADGEAVQERCTAKATIYTANLLSGLVCKAVKDLLTRPDYLRSAQWDIGQDAFLAHRKRLAPVPTLSP